MRKLIELVFVFVLLSLMVFGQQSQQPQTVINTQGLTAEQVQSINTLTDQLRKQPNTLANFTLQNATPDKFKEWADAGAAAGKAVSGFTKEVGIAADQFLKTDTGKVALYALIWKLGGNNVVASLLNTVLKIALAVLLYTFWWKLTRRFVFNEQKIGEVEYNQNTLLRWLGFNKKTSRFQQSNWIDTFEKSDKFWITFWSRTFSVVLLVTITVVCWPSVSF